MKRLFVLLTCLLLITPVFAESLDEIFEQQELGQQVLQILIDQADEKGEDTTKAEKLFKEYKELLDEAEDLAEEDEGKAWQKVQEAFQVATELQEEFKELGVGQDNDESKEEKVEKAVEDLKLHIELINTMLDNIEDAGKDTDKPRKELKEIQKLYNDMKDAYDDGDFDEAHTKLMKLYVQLPELQKELDKFEEFEDKDKGKSTKEKVEGHLENMAYQFEITEIILDQAEEQGKDVKKARTLYEDLVELGEKAESEADRGDYETAWKTMLRIFIKASEFQKEFKKISPDDGRTNKERVEDTLSKWDGNAAMIEHVLDKAEEKDIDISKAESLFDEIEDGVDKAEKLADKEEYDDAWRELMKVFIKSNEFQKEFKLVLAELENPEEQKEKIKDIIDNFNRDYEVLLVFLDAQEDAGRDVDELRDLLNDVKELLDEADGVYEEDYKAGWKLIQKAFVKGHKLHKKFKNLAFNPEDIKDSIDQAQNNFDKAQDTIDALDDKGADVEDLQDLLDKIKKHVNKAEDLYERENYEAASNQLRKAFNLGNKLEKLSKELVEEYK